MYYISLKNWKTLSKIAMLLAKLTAPWHNRSHYWVYFLHYQTHNKIGKNLYAKRNFLFIHEIFSPCTPKERTCWKYCAWLKWNIVGTNSCRKGTYTFCVQHSKGLMHQERLAGTGRNESWCRVRLKSHNLEGLWLLSWAMPHTSLFTASHCWPCTPKSGTMPEHKTLLGTSVARINIHGDAVQEHFNAEDDNDVERAKTSCFSGTSR